MTIYLCVLGVYNKTLSKMVYLDNRKFLPEDSPLRKDARNFPSKSKELLSAPQSRKYAELRDNHVAHDNAKNK